MKRLALILVLLLVLLPTLAACGEGEAVTADEILPIARALIERSVTVNTAMIGDGVPTGSEAFGEYIYADRAWESKHSVRSVEDLLTLTASVYTTAVYDVLYRDVITKDGVEPPDYQNRAKTDTNPEGGLLVHKDRRGWYENTVHEYLFDTMALTAAGEDHATVAITVRITPDGKAPQERKITLPLVRTEDGWRFDKLTYVAYDNSSVNQ